MLLGIGEELDNQAPCCSNKITTNFHNSKTNVWNTYDNAVLEEQDNQSPCQNNNIKTWFQSADTKTYGSAVVEELNSHPVFVTK